MGNEITSVHVCGEEVYVERNGRWHLVVAKGERHCFAVLKNWSADVWERRAQNPPCHPVNFRRSET